VDRDHGKKGLGDGTNNKIAILKPAIDLSLQTISRLFNTIGGYHTSCKKAKATIVKRLTYLDIEPNHHFIPHSY
jgi:hypothetical protein